MEIGKEEKDLVKSESIILGILISLDRVTTCILVAAAVVMIWVDFNLGFKIGLTCLMGLIIIYFFHSRVKKSAIKKVTLFRQSRSPEEKQSMFQSMFEQRLNNYMNQLSKRK